ncbi:MAG: hypothetical protein E6H03_10950 [Bacillati bacterium ANGP1]|uniref:Uncharacterized protein n=1 Tax=Candidatus Segetimicrobium genomatis TaxID=2569760 RepID=A0A537J6D7_9BACT|nr:MAG: hypothetical protein E6H03_10950 [Terrabacteria group bacterium ANGP1]
MEPAMLDALHVRIGKLERLMKLMTIALVFATILLTVLTLTLRQVTSYRVLRSRGIDIVDDAGHHRLRMGMTRDGASVLRIYDGTQKERLGLFVARSGATGIVLFGAQEQQRAALSVLPAGMPELRLHDTHGQELFAAP